ncbi:MAG TPA: tRNA (adenosine(37)-N6)-threonylcarbamoyltransferase complex dimerization subunit type 1 TsaB [Streptosporangiaceae bacterium]|nr:tRNA (adenosine(37)-N6)-threonylcarbamoyltransferase complex dimerization subunit type 1 TsaB [Streptosporangiaceae bacterium]
MATSSLGWEIVLLLALDTATPAVTVALHDGSAVVAELSTVDARRHGEVLAVFIDQVLRKAGAERADLTAIAVGVGPGPYTGLRAGVVTARVLGSALDIRTDGICSLDVIAAQATAGAGGSEFLVATDARRREVYWALYAPDGERSAGPYVSRPPDVPAGLPVAGEGAVLYPELGSRALAPRYPAAAQLACLAVDRMTAGLPPRLAEPLYLRRPDAREPGPPKRVTP